MNFMIFLKKKKEKEEKRKAHHLGDASLATSRSNPFIFSFSFIFLGFSLIV
jgi:hypothetical protein